MAWSLSRFSSRYSFHVFLSDTSSGDAFDLPKEYAHINFGSRQLKRLFSNNRKQNFIKILLAIIESKFAFF